MLDFPQVEIELNDLERVKNGMKLSTNSYNDGEFVVLLYAGRLVSVAQVESGCFIQKKVFA